MCSLIVHTSPSSYSHEGSETSICNFEVIGVACESLRYKLFFNFLYIKHMFRK